jgi:hypothetical protein
MEPRCIYGVRIAQTALRSVGGFINDSSRTNIGNPEYAGAVSLIFTEATNQAIMPGTEPGHVVGTSILCNSLLHDKRFKQVSMSEAAPGDIVIESGGHQQAGYAGVVVDHGRIVSNSSQGVRNNSSLFEIPRNHPATIIFRYVGVQKHPSHALANAGYNPNEPRIPKGQHGGGQWTTGGAAGGDQNEKERAADASRLELLAKRYLQEAKSEQQKADLAADEFGLGDEYQRLEAAAKAAKDLAAEMQRRAYILTHGTEANYRNLMLKEYGINNPDLDSIAAYYAKKFNDQPTLNWLKLQHPAPRPRLDPNSLAMMALFPEGEAAEEALGAGSAPETSVFNQATRIEEGAAQSDGEASVGEPRASTGGGQTGESDSGPSQKGQIGKGKEQSGGKGLLGPRSSTIKKLASGEDVPVPQGTTGIRAAMAEITNRTGNEVGLFRLTNGTRVLRMGGPDYINGGQEIERIIAHTHPSGTLRLSKTDVASLTRMGQRSTVIIVPRGAFGKRFSTSGNW